MPNLIGTLLDWIENHPQLWEIYYEEVLQKKLSSHLKNDPWIKKYLASIINLSGKDLPIIEVFLRFHIYLYVHYLDILRVVRALRPLTLFHHDFPESEKEFGTDSSQSFSSYIVHKLYQFLHTQHSSGMQEWLKCYQNIVSY